MIPSSNFQYAYIYATNGGLNLSYVRPGSQSLIYQRSKIKGCKVIRNFEQLWRMFMVPYIPLALTYTSINIFWKCILNCWQRVLLSCPTFFSRELYGPFFLRFEKSSLVYSTLGSHEAEYIVLGLWFTIYINVISVANLNLHRDMV